KGRLPAQFCRQNFQSHETVQLRLARLIHCPHSALAEELNDFELRKILGLSLRTWWRFRSFRWLSGLAAQAAFHQARGAKPFGRFGRQRRAALSAYPNRLHNQRLHPYRSKIRRRLREKFREAI